jgi:hypothetical protein
MATKKKSKMRKPTKPARKKIRTAKKRNAPKKAAKKSAAPKKTAAPRKTALKRKSVAKKAGRKKPATKQRIIARGGSRDEAVFSRPRRVSQPGEQAGDLQGLSNIEAADSESVDELLEEGNAFEADVVSGVQAADDADEQEVHTHEVPEDDVPAEYLDEE